MKKFALFLVAGIFLCTAGSAYALGITVENRVYDSTIDHYYFLVVYDMDDSDPTIPNKSWDSADSFVTSLNNPYLYLATITSEAEQQVMESLFVDPDDQREFWLGGGFKIRLTKQMKMPAGPGSLEKLGIILTGNQANQTTPAVVLNNTLRPGVDLTGNGMTKAT